MGTPDDLLSVCVTEPVKLPNGIQGYRIITTTNMTDVDKYQRHENIVIKPYSEFVRLRDKLSEEFPGIDIPQAPNVVGFSAKSIEMQCRALDFFLKSLVSRSSSFYNSVNLKKFLVAEAVAVADEEYGKCVPRMAARLSTDLEEILIFVKKIKEPNMAGNMVLLDGGNLMLRNETVKQLSDWSGESACKVTYFCSISGSEERLQDKLKEGLRRATGLRVPLSRKVYEGEVTEFQKNYTTESNTTLSSISIELRTTQETKKLSLGELYLDALCKEQVVVGDSIVIDIESRAVQNKGPITNASSSTPRGKVHKIKKIAQNVSLHDLDKAITRKKGGIFTFLISQNQNVSAVNIDEVVESLIHKGLATRIYGILYISEAHNLNIECFSLINNALESSYLSVYLTTIRGMCKFRGVEIYIPNKIPSVLLPRMIVMRAPKDEDVFRMATFFWSSTERQRLVTPLVDRLKRKNLTNCVVLLAGPLQTEKSGLAFQVAQKLGNEDLFFPMIESDEYPVEELKEILENTIRRAVGLKMRKTIKVYEGEVVELSSKEAESSSDIVIGLKTDKNQKHIELEAQLSKAIRQEKVAIGDVICIDVHNKAVTRIGRCDSFAAETDHEKKVYVALPKGDILKQEKIQDITMYDLYKTEKQGHSICKRVRKEISSEQLTGGDVISQVDSLDVDILKFISDKMNTSENVFPVLIFSTEKDISEFCFTNLSENVLKHMVIVHTQACGPPENSIKELEPRTKCSVPALDKEVKSIDAFQLLNASFGAGAIASIVLAAANSDTPPHTFGFLIGAFVCCNLSLLHYLCVAFDLQSSIKKAKDSKSTKEIWIDRSKVKELRFQVFCGFLAGSLGVGWVMASLVAYISKKFDNPTWMFVALLVILGGSYAWFVKKIRKELTAAWCRGEQRTL
ncbi:hypothetical protein MKW98_007858 [Papaver atlanticum]|uniref:DNA helicase n=1 Tax=Papaver atlanticum TaxID=357466 RepID=A0AAD4X6K8_9MAGN|nr:hypothetical protein MKW98_007858 [Papaver atlanticum]